MLDDVVTCRKVLKRDLFLDFYSRSTSIHLKPNLFIKLASKLRLERDRLHASASY